MWLWEAGASAANKPFPVHLAAFSRHRPSPPAGSASFPSCLLPDSLRLPFILLSPSPRDRPVAQLRGIRAKRTHPCLPHSPLLISWLTAKAHHVEPQGRGQSPRPPSLGNLRRSVSPPLPAHRLRLRALGSRKQRLQGTRLKPLRNSQTGSQKPHKAMLPK